MSNALEETINLLTAEEEHSRAITICFIYFAALAETRYRGARSDLYECLPPNFLRDCDDDTALKIHNVIIDFIERCPSHPNVGGTFRTLLYLKASDNLEGYLIEKLKLYYGQGNAFNVFQICTVLTDMGLDIFRDESGKFMQSRGSNEAEVNMGVARRFLGRLNK